LRPSASLKGLSGPKKDARVPLTAESVLKAIVEAASKTKGRAALSHYPSRRLWAARLHERLTAELESLRTLHARVLEASGRECLGPESTGTEPKTLFISITPVLLKHHAELLQKLLSVSGPTPIYKMGDPGIEKTFEDFNVLLSACRQYIDAALQDAYQLNELNPAEFNYAVLSSLSRFLELAPPSLRVPFLTDELFNALRAFEQDKQQRFATSRVRRFHEVAKRLVAQLNPEFVPRPQEFLESIFRFSSDFAHAGFISSLVTATKPAGVYLGCPDGVFFASTENYAEVQFMVLKACLFTYADVYLRAVKKALRGLFHADVADGLARDIDTRISGAKGTFEWIGREMHAWVSNDAMLRKTDIWFGCPCRTRFVWPGRYYQFDRYCPSCGTVVRIMRMREPFSYCVMPEGPCDVFGSNGPLIDNLPEQLRKRLYDIWEEFRKFAETLPKSDFIPLLLVGDISTFEMRLPERNPQELTTFISSTAVEEGEGIPISCNCSFMSLWLPKRGQTVEQMVCWACGSSIRLLLLEGDGGYVPGRVAGKTELFDIQASKSVPAWRLPQGEREKIIREFDQRRPENRESAG
jgi:hypothetical protein